MFGSSYSHPQQIAWFMHELYNNTLNASLTFDSNRFTADTVQIISWIERYWQPWVLLLMLFGEVFCWKFWKKKKKGWGICNSCISMKKRSRKREKRQRWCHCTQRHPKSQIPCFRRTQLSLSILDSSVTESKPIRLSFKILMLALWKNFAQSIYWMTQGANLSNDFCRTTLSPWGCLETLV